MLSFEFKRSNRKCAITDKPFLPGQRYISALFEENDELVRRDYAESEWNGPEDSCIGWWSCVVPELDSGKIYWAPNDVLLSYFQSLLDLPGCESILFVTALLLVQKKILKLQDTDEENTLLLYHKKSKSEFVVPVIALTADQKSAIQTELSEQLFTDQAPDVEDPE